MLHFQFLRIFLIKHFPSDKGVIRTAVAVIGKALSEASFTIIFLFTTELYPTVIRLVNNKLKESNLQTIIFYYVVTTCRLLQVYINLSALIFQTEWVRLHFISGTSGRLHIATHHAIGGRVASPPCTDLLCSGSWVRFSGISPA